MIPFPERIAQQRRLTILRFLDAAGARVIRAPVLAKTVAEVGDAASAVPADLDKLAALGAVENPIGDAWHITDLGRDHVHRRAHIAGVARPD